MADPNIASNVELTWTDTNTDDSEGDTSSSSESDGDPGQNTFRSIPDPERMNPLLIAMAQAAQHAPKLERMWLIVDKKELRPRYLEKYEYIDAPSYLDDDWSMVRHFQVFYVAKGAQDHEERAPDDKARLIWQVGDWRPDEEVERHWKDVLSPSQGTMVYNDPDYMFQRVQL